MPVQSRQHLCVLCGDTNLTRGVRSWNGCSFEAAQACARTRTGRILLAPCSPCCLYHFLPVVHVEHCAELGYND